MLAVLVIDDQKLQRDILTKRLEHHGVGRVYEARDGGEGIEILATQKVDLVLCDLDMPKVDGLAVVRALIESASSVRFALLSAAEPVVLECVEMMTEGQPIRFLGALEKPIHDDKLSRLLDGALMTMVPPRPKPQARPLSEITLGLSRNEFVPYFQPVVDATNGKVVSAEALARWQHPTEGVLSPYFFLDRMEAMDGCTGLTWAVLDGVLEFLQSTQELFPDLSISVNLSGGFLAHTGVSHDIANRISKFGVSAHQVTFELTESTALTKVVESLENLTRLRLRGHRIAVDDFGSAYASLRQLVRVPFHVMKFDRTFLRDAMHLERAWTILKSSVQMATDLKMTTVIEGVETREERERLLGLGATYHQGYYYARPMAGAELITWMQKDRARHSDDAS